MDSEADLDFNEYLSEYRLQVPAEPVSHYEEGELEAQWLAAAGFSALTKPFEQGYELHEKDLEPILKGLPKAHAEAVKHRVYILNRTVRGRSKFRNRRKPDIRSVFRDCDDSSTGSRSRSATPDSLDSIPGDNWSNVNTVQNQEKTKQKLKRTPSAPLRASADLFRGSHVRCDIPVYTVDGIELLGFQKFGTLQMRRQRSGSDPSCSLGFHRDNMIRNSGSHSDLLIPATNESKLQSLFTPPAEDRLMKNFNFETKSYKPPKAAEKSNISFESMCRKDNEEYLEYLEPKEPSIDINDINELELKKLQSLFWLELATLFDKYNVALDKRKPFRRRKKEEGNLFGVSLNALIRRDQQIADDATLVPLFLQGLLHELTKRGIKEEGILRVAGHKQKTEMLYNELEITFYHKPDKAFELLQKAGVHDLSTLLKKWLRELPQPLLTNNLIQLFYQTYAIPPPDQYKALSVICLLLPHENRNTLRSLLSFLKNVINHQAWNKMSAHNVATITAPSLFPPRFIHPLDKNDIEEQVKMAAHCCYLTKILILQGESLFMVPTSLLDQIKLFKNKQARKMGKRRQTQVDNAC